MWVVGYGWLILAKTSEVPYGHKRITFDDDLQPNPDKPLEYIPQAALDLQDGKVFIQGYMQPRRQQMGIREFVLCPSNGDCPFCMVNPKPTQMIRVILQGDLQVNYTTHLISVAGRFRVNLDDPGGLPYGIDADYFR